MQVIQYNKVKTIVKTLNQNSGNTIIPIYQNDGFSDATSNTKTISVNAFVKNLKAYGRITSLPKINLPNFELEDSETQKLHKVLDLEWNSPRKQLSLYISDGGNWEIIGSISLLNSSGYPYRMYNLMDLYTDNLAIELGINGKLGAKIEDVGYGALASGDNVTIHGSYVEEFVLEDTSKSISQCINYQWSCGSESQTILFANSNRKYVCIINGSPHAVYLSLGDIAELNKGILLVGNGSSYEINNYQGVISGISMDDVNLAGIECI